MSTVEDNPLLAELRFQLTVTRAMLGTHELDQVLYIILSGITHGDGLNFNRACLFLVDPERRELHPSFAVGPTSGAEAKRIWEGIVAERLDLPSLLAAYDAARDDETQHALSRRLAHVTVSLAPPSGAEELSGAEAPLAAVLRHAVHTREPFFSNGLRAVTRESPDAEPLVFHPLACVPLVLGSTVIGVILVDNSFNQREIDDDDMRGLMTLANLAAIAVHQARIVRQLREMAEHDGLTGLLNRRLYDQTLAREVERARREGSALAMVLFDLDHFKHTNDRHGHEVGDAVLRELAATLRRGVRGADVVARYGGDELVVLLGRGADRAAARQVAEKLRAEVERHSLGGRPAGEITVSAGIACLAGAALDAAALFQQADAALYAAKRGGRNRVVGADAP
jgi:diguanylate cyclase (GGDEF)-like protein